MSTKTISRENLDIDSINSNQTNTSERNIQRESELNKILKFDPVGEDESSYYESKKVTMKVTILK